MIITTAPKIFFGESNIPIITISPTLSSEDVTKIMKGMKEVKEKGNRSNTIFDYFKPEMTFYGLKFNTKEELLKYMSDELLKEGYVPEYFFDKTLKREQLTPSIFGKMAAMPHPIDACAIKSVISIAILDHPVRWDDEHNVQVIFLLAMRKSDIQTLNQFFEITVNLTNNPQLLHTILETKTFDDTMMKLKSAEHL